MVVYPVRNCVGGSRRRGRKAEDGVFSKTERGMDGRYRFAPGVSIFFGGPTPLPALALAEHHQERQHAGFRNVAACGVGARERGIGWVCKFFLFSVQILRPAGTMALFR